MSGSTGHIPAPKQGLVVTFNYLWHAENTSGREDARKARPCIIAAVAAAPDPAPGAEIHIGVLPITHAAPYADTLAVRVPDQHKRAMGLDSQPAWVICDEMNLSAWPGYDLCQTPQAADGWTRGIAPPSFLNTILTTIRNAVTARTFKQVSRL